MPVTLAARKPRWLSFRPRRGRARRSRIADFPSADYPSLEAVIRAFLATITYPVEHAAFAVAGPVLDGQAKITNLPWLVDVEVLKQTLGLRAVQLFNDLEAIALAVPILQPDDLHTINPGEAVAGGAIAVVAPGTGLGEAFLTWDGTRYQASPSEGGHADFAPTTAVEIGLLQYLLQRGIMSASSACSGSGLPNIYDYLRDSGYAPETPQVCPVGVGRRPDAGNCPGRALTPMRRAGCVRRPLSIRSFRSSGPRPVISPSRYWRRAASTWAATFPRASCPPWTRSYAPAGVPAQAGSTTCCRASRSMPFSARPPCWAPHTTA